MINSPFKDLEFKAAPQLYTYLNKLINAVSNDRKYTILMLADASLFLLAITVAICCEDGLNLMSGIMLRQGNFVLLEITIKIGLFWCVGVYQQVLRSTDGAFIFTISKAVSASCVVILALDRLLPVVEIPASVLLSDGMLSLILAISLRFGIRLLMGKMRQIDHAGKEMSKKSKSQCYCNA